LGSIDAVSIDSRRRPGPRHTEAFGGCITLRYIAEIDALMEADSLAEVNLIAEVGSSES